VGAELALLSQPDDRLIPQLLASIGHPWVCYLDHLPCQPPTVRARRMRTKTRSSRALWPPGSRSPRTAVPCPAPRAPCETPVRTALSPQLPIRATGSATWPARRMEDSSGRGAHVGPPLAGSTPAPRRRHPAWIPPPRRRADLFEVTEPAEGMNTLWRPSAPPHSSGRKCRPS
jgi:hypothetical protein